METNTLIEAPEFIRVADAVKRFGLSKSKIYQLIAKGQIASVSLRDRGQVKATRLLKYDSIREFIESKMVGGVSCDE